MNTFKNQPSIPRALTCSGKTNTGVQCRNLVNPPSKLCWHHARGFKKKWRALTRNQSVVFIFGVLGVLIGLLAWLYPEFWIHFRSHGSARIAVWLIPGKIASQIEEARIVIDNNSTDTQRQISFELGFPVISSATSDNPERVKIINGGQGANYIHILIPELIPGEYRRVTLKFGMYGVYSSGPQWSSEYKYPKSVMVMSNDLYKIGPIIDLRKFGRQSTQ